MRSSILSLAFWISLLLATTGSAAPGDELWEDHEDGGGFAGNAFTALAAGKLFLVGGTIDSPTGGLATLRAYDAKSGELAWQDQYLEAGLNDHLDALAGKGSRAFGAGAVRDTPTGGGGTQDPFVRAWKAKTGEVLWTSVVTTADTEDAKDVAVRGKVALALFEVDKVFPDADALLRAFDAKTGSILWSETYDTATTDSRDRPIGLAVSGKTVFVAGTTRISFTPDEIEGFLRAHDIRTGALLWEVTAPGIDVRDVVARGKSVFVGGNVATLTEDENWSVAAFDGRTGALLWEEELDVSARRDRLAALAVKGKRLLAAGEGQVDDVHADAFVRAYDTRSGAELWTNQYDGFGDFDRATDLTVAGRTVLAALDSDDAVDSAAEITMLAIDLKSGAFLWDARSGLATSDGDEANAIAARGRRAVIVGNRLLVPGDGTFYARGVSLK